MSWGVKRPLKERETKEKCWGRNERDRGIDWGIKRRGREWGMIGTREGKRIKRARRERRKKRDRFWPADVSSRRKCLAHFPALCAWELFLALRADQTWYINSQCRQGKGEDSTLYHLQQEPQPIWWPGATVQHIVWLDGMLFYRSY